MRNRPTAKTEKAVRLSASVALPLAFYLVCYFVKSSHLLFLFAAAFALALLYTVPYVIGIARIKRKADNVKHLIAVDALYGLLPSALSSFLIAIGFYLFSDGYDLVFVLAVVLAFLFVLISACFWLLYALNSAIVKIKDNDN